MNNSNSSKTEPTKLITPSRRLFLSRSAMMAFAGSASAMLIGAEKAFGATKEELAEVGDRGPQKANFKAIRNHENTHVDFLLTALGNNARPKPTFKGLLQKTFAEFAILAQALENTGVSAYLGAAPFLLSGQYLAAAGSIATVEARHSGFINTWLHDPITAPATDDDANPSFDVPMSSNQVVAAAGGFITSLNGGPPVGYANTMSQQNDLDILNFALALEFLEAEFYNLNYHKFYG